MRFIIDREALFICSLAGFYLLFFPLLFGSSPFLLPFIPAAHFATKSRSWTLSKVFCCGLIGDFYFSAFTFGLFTFFLLISGFSLRMVQRFIYVDSLFALSIFVFTLTLIFHFIELSYLSVLGRANFLTLLFQKELFFDPIKQGFFALFCFTLPLMAMLPKEERSLKIFSLKGSA